MKTINKISELKTELQVYRAHRLNVGFVPTMGALHEGHLSLIRRSKKENDVTIVSIFLNPTQFNDKKDLEKYPSNLDRDLEMLRSVDTTLLFVPEFNDLYPDDYKYRISENDFSTKLCGAHRPGHFDGVLTVVMKLLNLTISINVPMAVVKQPGRIVI